MGAKQSSQVGTVCDSYGRYLDYKVGILSYNKPTIGDVVFHENDVWLVRGKGLMKNTLILGSTKLDEIEEVINNVSMHDIIYLYDAKNLMNRSQPYITDYITWRAVFCDTSLSHFASILNDRNRLNTKIINDPILSRYLLNLSSLSDSLFRKSYTDMCYMQAAYDIISEISLDTIRV